MDLRHKINIQTINKQKIKNKTKNKKNNEENQNKKIVDGNLTHTPKL